VKILVTGAGGFLGYHVVERLLAHGHSDIRCFFRDAAKAERILPLVNSHPEAKIELCYGNLRSPSDCAKAVEGVSLGFHLAAAMKGAPAELFFDSVVVSRNLLEALESRDPVDDKSTRVVLVSSFGVYGVVPMGRGARIDELAPLETHPELRDPYSFSKLRQEQLFWDFQKKGGFELVVLRPGVLYGPGGGHFSTRVGLQIGPRFFHLAATCCRSLMLSIALRPSSSPERTPMRPTRFTTSLMTTCPPPPVISACIRSWSGPSALSACRTFSPRC